MSRQETRDSLPLTPGEEQAKEQAGKRDGVEVVIDNDYISIPRSRYDGLLRAEAALDVIHRFYGLNGCNYQMDNLMEALFGPRKEGDDA